MRISKVVALLGVTALLTSCGGGEDNADNSASVSPTTSSSSSPAAESSPIAAPTYVESDTCRNSMAPLVDVMLANDEDTLEFNVFDNRVKLLQKKIDAGLAPCSSEVSDPAREVMYNFVAADVRWSVCSKKDCIADVTKFIKDGLAKAQVVQYQVELQA